MIRLALGKEPRPLLVSQIATSRIARSRHTTGRDPKSASASPRWDTTTIWPMLTAAQQKTEDRTAGSPMAWPVSTSQSVSTFVAVIATPISPPSSPELTTVATTQPSGPASISPSCFPVYQVDDLDLAAGRVSGSPRCPTGPRWHVARDNYGGHVAVFKRNPEASETNAVPGRPPATSSRPSSPSATWPTPSSPGRARSSSRSPVVESTSMTCSW